MIPFFKDYSKIVFSAVENPIRIALRISEGKFSFFKILNELMKIIYVLLNLASILIKNSKPIPLHVHQILRKTNIKYYLDCFK